MRLIDLDNPKVMHFLCNLEPKWKPMAEIGDDERDRELSNVIEELGKLVITDTGSISDGYHTFDSLYDQRLVLFATLVNAFSDQAWKSHKHSDGTEPFGGGWFVVGINTPEGPYTYHYENEHWDIFHCKELETAPEWDGHTDKDVKRLLSLVPEPEEDSTAYWAAKEVELAIQSEKEAAEGTDDWQYGVGCYKSALRAYKSLARDNHSGFSIGITKSILNRLIDGRTLTPIEDTPDIWNEIPSNKDGVKEYQCKRMSSLFKRVKEDGTVSYSDIDRAYGVNVDSPKSSFTSGLIRDLIDTIAPISMPYLPLSKRYRVRCEEFLFDPKNGDYDTVAYLDILTPDDKLIELNRYFKEEDKKMVPIEKAEFEERKANRVKERH